MKTDFNKKAGLKIKGIRKALKLTQAGLAKKLIDDHELKSTQQNISKYESGDIRCPAEILLAVESLIEPVL